MAREYVIAWAGRHRRGPWEEICGDYRKRISRMAPVRDRPVRFRGSAADAERCPAEGRLLLEAVPDPCWTIALDSRGETMSSEAFSKQLVRLERTWPHPVAFLLGSDLGHGPSLLDACREVLSFGPMTLGHELARAVLYEQLYRALSIAAGINYHRVKP